MSNKVSRSDFCQDAQHWATNYRNLAVSPVIPTMDLDDRLRALEARVCLIEEPTSTQFEKYPALKAAYDEYKTIEKIILGNNDKT